MKNGPRVWAFCKIEFPGIQKPVQILTQKSRFFRNPGNRGVGVIWRVVGLFWLLLYGSVGGFYFSFRLELGWCYVVRCGFGHCLAAMFTQVVGRSDITIDIIKFIY